MKRCLPFALGLAGALFTGLPTPARADAPASPPISEQAASTEAFLDSIGLNPSFGRDSAYPKIKADILALGVRHIRVGLDSPRILDMAHSRVRSMVVVGMPYGPNNPATGQPLGPPYNGTAADLQKIRDTIKRINVLAGNQAIDSVEASNEPDLFWNTWYNQTYGGSGYPEGSNQFLRELYDTLKADEATARLTVIGTAIGKTPEPGRNPQGGKGELAAAVDWGNAHPYPGKGSTFSFGTTYDTIPAPADGSGRGGYEWNGTEPSNNMEVVPYFFNTLAVPYAPKPMACTETGYFTGTGDGSVSQTVFAKYVPRLFAEYFRVGVKRTFWYNFVDDDTRNSAAADSNRGLLQSDLTPKPAYVALKSLLTLLQSPDSPKRNATPGRLTYSLAVRPVQNYAEPNSGVTSSYDRTQYVHHLLLQQFNGNYCLLLWHEVSDAASVDKDGKAIHGTQRDILPPALPATLALPASINRATFFTYDSGWHLVPKPLIISRDHQVTLSVPDTITVLNLST